jgi:[ribosomal protein S5]-alanine N-acetyltransferase
MTNMPVLETERLRIRPFTMEDLDAAYHLLDVDLADASLGSEKMENREMRARWLQWSVLNYEQLALLNQPPYGDRALVLRDSGELIGACGYVPCLMPFEQMAYFGGPIAVGGPRRSTPELGLFYAVSPAQRRKGYALEAARALLAYAFDDLNVKRVVATTEYENAGSMGVMRALGMRIERNPLSEPPWMQVVGVIEE